MVLIFGMMMQQSVTDDVNEYYWTVEAEDAGGEEQGSDVVVGDDGAAVDAYCGDVGGASNPDAEDGMWTWDGGQYQCRVTYNATNGYVEEYLNGAQCYS